MGEVNNCDIVLWTEAEAALMHEGYRKKAGVPAAGTEALFAAAMVGYRKRDTTAQAEIEALRARVAELEGALVDADEALGDALDDMEGEGLCVCKSVKLDMIAAHKQTRAALSERQQ